MLMCCNSKRLKTGESPNRSKSKPKQRNSEICPMFTKERWIEIMKRSFEDQGYSELSYNLRHNFPLELRCQVWFWLTEKARIKSCLYQKLQFESPSEQQILKDLHRSFRSKRNTKRISGSSDSSQPDKNQEQGKVDQQKLDKLKRILIAYSNLDKEVKYVQGMNFIASSILEQLEQEELCFIILNHILNIQNYRKVFLMDMTILEIIDKRIQFEVPLIYNKMQELKVKPQYCFDTYIFSLFQLVRKELAHRIIDIFLFEKESILQTVIIQLLKMQQVEILKCQDQDEMIIYIRNDLIEDALDKLDDGKDYLSQLLSIHL
ncbi:unnamed protein product (macronuclear) [Paramecium tetraurelia]|uniref:Rab-GAP TBC domain-containing protein n=1 Tax=Paramecium tetraurelia TaxID=5888 RepID=A0CXV4_PARTE|nr:uncharacterized protein GSPATT00011253001 [Paramecium tetraurelia]CAK75621.1 unnamed protein product [Paramecium tetraurelia]|eukprot:XP_001443018.1 hypothetical protein (macronuclear) [Paramecium tetraurelia strain d4-2]